MRRVSVALVNMPFAALNLPALGLSLLKAALTRDGHEAEIHYLNLGFADRIGMPLYNQVANAPTVTLLGEWVFAPALFDTDPHLDREYLEEFLPRFITPDTLHNLSLAVEAIRREVRPYLQRCLEAVDWSRYDVIGFTSSFQQNVATLALARLLKDRYPDKLVVVGGANTEGVMGLALLRAFPFVGAICSGEGDRAFPELVRRVGEGEPLSGIPGITLQGDALPFEDPQGAPVYDMDALPYPDFDDYFEQLYRYPWSANLRSSVRLLFESARGCWWGAKSHCTFCGLNGSTMTFRSKSADRALAELRYLHDRYGAYTRNVSAVDNIIDMKYFQTFLPALKETGLEIGLFYETKANLTRTQVQTFAEAGVTDVQPGIESLSTSVLGLMRKGVTALQNVQMLKWCREFGVRARWNYLYGFPGEDPEEYSRVLRQIPALRHLDPPNGPYPLRLDRFSPYFRDPVGSGLANVRPFVVYRYIYVGIPEELLFHLAYYFDFDHADGRQPRSYVAELRQAVAQWREDEGSELFSVDLREERVIFDLRPVAQQHVYRLRGAQRRLYEYCDGIRSWRSVRDYLGAAGYTLSDRDLSDLIRPLLEAQLMMAEGDRLLSLAIPLGVYSPGVAGAKRFLQFLHQQRAAARVNGDEDVTIPYPNRL